MAGVTYVFYNCDEAAKDKRSARSLGDDTSLFYSSGGSSAPRSFDGTAFGS